MLRDHDETAAATTSAVSYKPVPELGHPELGGPELGSPELGRNADAATPALDVVLAALPADTRPAPDLSPYDGLLPSRIDQTRTNQTTTADATDPAPAASLQ